MRELSIENEAPQRILLGRHLIELELRPSPDFKRILDAVYEKQLDGQITNLDEAIDTLQACLRVLDLVNRVGEMIKEERYWSALKVRSGRSTIAHAL